MKCSLTSSGVKNGTLPVRVGTMNAGVATDAVFNDTDMEYVPALALPSVAVMAYMS